MTPIQHRPRLGPAGHLHPNDRIPQEVRDALRHNPHAPALLAGHPGPHCEEAARVRPTEHHVGLVHHHGALALALRFRFAKPMPRYAPCQTGRIPQLLRIPVGVTS